ncbi:heparin lyase I family protein [Marimonas lutisalis]|uniref:heparin lyase I family protein n=1 Tax=Marimonas lutisalis TaxID=2545756 RepID=UPI0010F6877A|nr:heparin lyase I family protein [Marimonas lutisalis]
MTTFLHASTKRYCALLIMLVAFGSAVIMPQNALAKGRSYKDNDWNKTAYDNCGLPVVRGEKRSVDWVRVGGDKKIRMTLRERDVGLCFTDAKVRHGAPYWERAELKQSDDLPIGRIHRVQFETIFLEGFTGERETFFQFHGWNGNCHAYPPLMLMFNRGWLEVHALQNVSGSGIVGSSRGFHRNVARKPINIRSVLGKTLQFSIDFDTRTRPGRLSVLVNGSPLVEDAPIGYARCAKPHFKFGVYRPGGKGSKTSTALFDDFTVKVLK